MVEASTNRPLRVVLIEDSSLVRQSLGNVLTELGGVEVVGGAEDERSAIELLLLKQPDLAILDLQLRTGSGLGVLRALFRNPDQFGHPRTVVFSNHDQKLVREHCFALGIEGFFDKASQMAALVAYVRQAMPS